MAGQESGLPAAPQVNNDFSFLGRPREKVANSDVDDMETDVISAVDQGRPPLGLLDEKPEEVRFLRVVYALNTSFGHDAATVGLVGGAWSVFSAPLFPAQRSDGGYVDGGTPGKDGQLHLQT